MRVSRDAVVLLLARGFGLRGGGLSRAAVLAACLANSGGCAWLDPSEPERLARCLARPAEAVPVPWRALRLPPSCGRAQTFVSEGGSLPQLPLVAFPIYDEQVFRQAFTCVGAGPVDVDFGRERIEKLEGLSLLLPAWVARLDGRLIAKVNRGVYCGGITPERLATLIVVPADAPPLVEAACSVGSCRGPPRP